MSSKKSTDPLAGGFELKFHPRVLGSAAPVFPGFEIDISDRVSDDDKPDAIWHRDRARQILREHPEIKRLFVNTPSTALWCGFFVTAQISLALAAGWMEWWVALILAWLIGAWINMNLFTLAHECNHKLVFKREWANRWLFTLTTLPMFLSGHHTWWIEHHVHHNDMGAKKDFIKRRRSFLLMTKQRVAIFFSRGPIYNLLYWAATPLFQPYTLIMLVTQAIRSTLGLLVYAIQLPFRGTTEPSDLALTILADEHLISGYQRYGVKRWAVAYPLCSLAMIAALFLIGGWKSVFYLLSCSLFMTGFLHPVMFGMLLSNSHFHGHSVYQPTASYYGWFNRLTFNFGLHTEHHDIAGIPWRHLPKLRQIAPEAYDELLPTRSYAGLALSFAFCKKNRLEERFGNEIDRNLKMIDASGKASEPVNAASEVDENRQEASHSVSNSSALS